VEGKLRFEALDDDLFDMHDAWCAARGLVPPGAVRADKALVIGRRELSGGVSGTVSSRVRVCVWVLGLVL